MPEIRFDTGLVTYDINGACSVSFNPTDTNFVERLFATFEELGKLQDAQEQEAQADGSPAAFFEKCRQRDGDMRALVDKIFSQPVSEAVFGPMSLYALADGLPVWANFVLSVMDEVDTSFAREQKRTSPRLKKYTDKYKRK